ncbi:MULTISPECIES: peptide ligase PGM1-related protein [unclassified Streptomyces]|uniref:peptide ligase PGM1-related protein n=1 Tax=unclassified Streptomyces TaxID=2593676 RepID=UPI0022B65343|nr:MULTISPECIES: peptide ligase PGM1-related protein [unclassified Streptomyces]MCZ7416834.1 peptide ligase PGM1-related protein [Streptomyces sp. WMMC897]MCZ7433341.1 peptide ligase PGM1-related protein [Streptomyces sp. WMMC1477]
MIEADQQVDYYLGLLTAGTGPGRGTDRARVRVVSLDDSSPRWLSEKLLDPDSPKAAEVRAALRSFAQREADEGAEVSLNYFEPSEPLEHLAQELGVPGDQIHSSYIPLGTKDAGRRLLLAAGVAVPAGSPLCHSTADLARETARLVRGGYRRFVLKLNSTAYGGGLGNALLDLGDLDPSRGPDGVDALTERVLARLPHAALVDAKLSWPEYAEAVARSGAVAEELVEGDEVRSPSFQGRITGEGAVEVASTHDQVLSEAAQTYTGCSFPADDAYRRTILEHGVHVGRVLAQRGAHGGDYGVDFLVRRTAAGWQVLGCELNLRATATKHAFAMVTGLLGTWPTEDGRLFTEGEERVYEASDSIVDPRYRGLRPTQLIAAVADSPLRYDAARRTGVVLHMMSAVLTYGKFGAVCVGRDRAEARRLMRQLRELADGLVATAPGAAAGGRAQER